MTSHARDELEIRHRPETLARNRRIAQLLAAGCSQKQVSDRVAVSESTVKSVASELRHEAGVSGHTRFKDFWPSFEDSWLARHAFALSYGERLKIEPSEVVEDLERLQEYPSYKPPRFSHAVISHLRSMYESASFSTEVSDLDGFFLNEDGRKYPALCFPAKKGQTLESLIDAVHLDATWGGRATGESVAVRDPLPRVLRHLRGGGTASEAELHTSGGWNLCFTSILRDGGELKLRVRLGEYGLILDSCDALIDEVISAEAQGFSNESMSRRRAINAAEGNPLVRAEHRAAGLGIAALLTYVKKDASGRYVLFALLGWRSGEVDTYPNTWHVAPAGMFNWPFENSSSEAPPTQPWGQWDPQDIRTSILWEYLEELRGKSELSGPKDRVSLWQHPELIELMSRGTQVHLTGVAIDLANLRPEICVLLYVPHPDFLNATAATEFAVHELSPNSEYDILPSLGHSKKGFKAYEISDSHELIKSQSLGRDLAPSETVAAGAAACWMGVARARTLFAADLAAIGIPAHAKGSSRSTVHRG